MEYTNTFDEKCPLEKRIYTSKQLVGGSFLGGPFSAVYFLKKNYDVIGDKSISGNFLRNGMLLVMAYCFVIPFLPEKIPSVVYCVAYSVIATSYFQSKQKDKLADAPRHSHWRVVGISAIWLILTLFAIIGIAMLYDSAGLINLSEENVAP
jgi:hypothetical protein